MKNYTYKKKEKREGFFKDLILNPYNPSTNGPSTVTSAVCDAPPAATVSVAFPIPRTKPVLTVSLLPPAAREGITPSA